MKPTTKRQFRYGIAELFGRAIDRISRAERDALLDIALHEPVAKYPECPLRLPAAGGETRCSKRHGICSLRRYARTHAAARRVLGAEASPTVTCPLRFHERLEVFSWVAQEVLRAQQVVLVSEVPFLEATPRDSADTSAGTEAVGRIDMIVVDHASLTSPRLEWCAMETQAVYFSGAGMEGALEAIRSHPDESLPFPDRIRRPDHRSSAPKRLMPQLQIKVPALRRWGRKMAVVVDRHFFDWMGSLNPAGDISSCDIVWFIVDIVDTEDPGRLGLSRYTALYTTLENAVIGLTGGTPVPLSIFEERVRSSVSRGVVLPSGSSSALEK